MDSSPPPPARRHQRPWYLVAGMVLTWFAGVNGLTNGFNTLSVLRAGTVPDVTTAMLRAHDVTGFMESIRATADLGGAVALATLQTMQRTAFPIYAAQLLLSALLVVGSGLAMSGRKTGRSLALQAIAANAALALVAFVLLRPVRAAVIEAMALATASDPSKGWWSFRARFVLMELGPLAAGAWALTRPRTKAFFDAVARLGDEPDES